MILLFIRMFSGALNVTIAPTALGGSGGNATGLGDPQASTLPTFHTEQSKLTDQIANADISVPTSAALEQESYEGFIKANKPEGWMQRLKNRFFGYDNKNTAMQVYKPEGQELEESEVFESATDNNGENVTHHGHVANSPYVREVGGTSYYTNLIDPQVKSDRTFAFIFDRSEEPNKCQTNANQTTGEYDQSYEEPSGDSGFDYFTSWLEALKPFINENNQQLANILLGASGVAAVISTSSTAKYQWQLRKAKNFYDGEKPYPKDKDEQEKLYRDALAFFDEIIEKISKDLATETVNADTAATSDDPSATLENGSTEQTEASTPVNQTSAFFALAKEILDHFKTARKAIEDDQLVTPEILKNVFDNIKNQCEKIISDVEKTITDFITNNEKSEDDSEMNLSKAKNFVEQTANFIISTATIESAKKDKIEYLHFIFIIFGIRFKEQTKKCIENPAGLNKEEKANDDEEKGAGTISTPEGSQTGPENTIEQPATKGNGESGSSEAPETQGVGSSTETGSTSETPGTEGTVLSGTSGTLENTAGNSSKPGTTSAQTGTEKPKAEGIGSSAASGTPGTVGNPTSSTVTQGQHKSGASTAQTQNPVQKPPVITLVFSADGKLTQGNEQLSSTPLDGSSQPLTAQHSDSQPSATPSRTVSGSQPPHKESEETPTPKPTGKIQGKGNDRVAPAGAGSIPPSDDGNKPAAEPQNATPKNVKKGVNPWVIGGLCLVGVIAVAAAAYFAMTMLKE